MYTIESYFRCRSYAVTYCTYTADVLFLYATPHPLLSHFNYYCITPLFIIAVSVVQTLPVNYW